MHNCIVLHCRVALQSAMSSLIQLQSKCLLGKLSRRHFLSSHIKERRCWSTTVWQITIFCLFVRFEYLYAKVEVRVLQCCFTFWVSLVSISSVSCTVWTGMLRMQDYKSLCRVITMCGTLVNTHTNKQTQTQAPLNSVWLAQLCCS